MTAQQIINKFELYVSDQTELSTQEELDLLNNVYQDTFAYQPWEFLKTVSAGQVLTDATGSYIPLPLDFSFFSENNNATDDSIGTENNASPKVVFIVNGLAYIPYQIVNFSDRRQYVNRNGYCYLDLANNLIRFTYPPQFTQYEFDYIKVPPDLTLNDVPLFPDRFQDILVYKMASDHAIIELSDRAHSYMNENLAKANQTLLDLQYWNSQLILN